MNFDEKAKTWDQDYRKKRAGIIADKIRSCVGTDTGRSAMEYGCGTGLVSFSLADMFQSITLVDASCGMIDVLKEKILQSGTSKMSALHADLMADEEIIGGFDVIYTSMALHHIKDTEGIIRRFFDHLRYGGCLCLVDLDKENGDFHSDDPQFDGHNGYDQEELKHVLHKAGFNDVRAETFYHDAKAIGDRKVPYSLFCMHAVKAGRV